MLMCSDTRDRGAIGPNSAPLQRAKSLADHRYFEPLSVDDLALAAGLSRAHFSRAFCNAFGTPPHAYVRDRRLERAAALLRRTDRPVVEICRCVGWRSVGSFTTSFTRGYGASPTVYRAGFPPASDHALIPEYVRRAYCGHVSAAARSERIG
jgi:AraC-like DNA-binding protein